jgi:DNA-binding transcriptional regulator/RsmH inhibitor MraZ
MAYSKSERYTLAVTYDKIRVPAVEQEAQHLGYNDAVEVTVYPESDAIDSFTFTGHLDSSSRVTIPQSIRQRFDFWDQVTVSLEATGERWSPEVDASARKAVYESAHPEQQSFEAVTDIVSADD